MLEGPLGVAVRIVTRSTGNGQAIPSVSSLLHLCVDNWQQTNMIACNIEQGDCPDGGSMNCTGIDPPRRASLEIASNMSVAGEQIVGLERHEATKLLIRVAMGYSQATSSHGHQTAAFQACAALECDRLAQAFVVAITIPEDEKTRNRRTLADDIGRCQVATVDQNFRSLSDKHGYCESGSLNLVMRVRKDSDMHGGRTLDEQLIQCLTRLLSRRALARTSGVS